MKDPTRDEMLEHLKKAVDGADEFDMEEAIYWFAADYHGGQASNLYEALSTSPYAPSPLHSGPGETARQLYQELEQEYGA